MKKTNHAINNGFNQENDIPSNLFECLEPNNQSAQDNSSQEYEEQIKDLKKTIRTLQGQIHAMNLQDESQNNYSFNESTRGETTTKSFNMSEDRVFDFDPQDFYTFATSKIFGHDDEIKAVSACLNGYFNKCNYAEESNYEFKNMPYNFIITGPSGSGKTELYRCLKAYLESKKCPLKVLLKDMTSLTEEGYKGEDKGYIVDGLDEDGYGIVFLDEFDKRLMPSTSSSGENTALAAQVGILQLIEGNQTSYSDKKEGRHNIDTRNTLFIAMGAFSGIKHAEKKGVEYGIGFGKTSKKDVEDKYSISKDDIAAWGGDKQLLGRFCKVINFKPITDDVIKKIVDKQFNTYKKIFKCEFEISEKVYEEVKEKITGDYGCREINSLIFECLLPIYENKNVRAYEKIKINSLYEPLELTKREINASSFRI